MMSQTDWQTDRWTDISISWAAFAAEKDLLENGHGPVGKISWGKVNILIWDAYLVDLLAQNEEITSETDNI